MKESRLKVCGLLLLLILNTNASANEQLKSNKFNIEEVIVGLSYPWSLAFISENQMLLTQRDGSLRHIVNHTVGKPITGLPEDLYIKGQGGLLDIVLHPEYRDNGWIYVSYSAGTDNKNTLKVFRAKLRDNQLIEKQNVFEVLPYRDTPVHYGAKMAFLEDNSLLITSGDGFDYREDAQRKSNQMGKILRILDDGGLPSNNPYIGETEKNLSAAVYTLGHRNPQGLVYDHNRNAIFSHEHGPDGGDEINIIVKGKNYGWPVITYGKDYSGARISPFTTYPGMEQPLVDWTPSIAPSGMAVYYGSMFPQMRGDLLVSTLKSKEVRWVKMRQKKISEQQSLFTDLGFRFRDVKVHPDGSIYLLVDGQEGKILRVTPKLD